jgi:hypothetical protein
MPSLTRLARDVAAKIWPVIRSRSRQGWFWLIATRDPITWADLRAGGTGLIYPLSRTYGGRFAAAAGIVLLLLLVLPWHTQERSWINEIWDFYSMNKDALAPVWAPLGTILVGIGIVTVGIGTMLVAGRQARIAAKQAQIAERGAITTAFYNAVSRLASDKIEERLGGIYMLERISRESPEDHWTVMENLTAFVRERTRPEAEWLSKPLDQRIADRAYSLWETAGRPVGRSDEFGAKAKAVEEGKTRGPTATDIAAVLAAIRRRSWDDSTLEAPLKRVPQAWGKLDLREGVLRGGDLHGAHLEHADLRRAHLEYADLRGAHLEQAELFQAHLEHADLRGTHLEHAALVMAHLECIDLRWAHLEHATLVGAHLENASLDEANLKGTNLGDAHLKDARLTRAHLEGADLTGVEGLTQKQIEEALGDAETKLPEGLSRPAHWTQPERGAEPAA